MHIKDSTWYNSNKLILSPYNYDFVNVLENLDGVKYRR